MAKEINVSSARAELSSIVLLCLHASVVLLCDASRNGKFCVRNQEQNLQ